MLPRSAKQPEEFARHATLFVQTMLLLTIPGAVFVGLEGIRLSRLLYGAKWVAADPLIWPGTLFAWGAAAALTFSSVLLARNHLRRVFVTNVLVAALGLPAIAVAAAGGGMLAYAWALALGQLVGTLIIARAASPDLQRDWRARAAGPPVTAAFLGAVVVLTVRPWTTNLPFVASIILSAALFGLTLLLALRLFFSRQLHEVVRRFPQGERVAKLLRLP
jgi:O-antigen/teichoic acid export membrane protein